MNPELIELYRAVQRFRGEWQHGDEYWNPKTKKLARYRQGYAVPKDAIWLPPVCSDDGRCLIHIVGKQKIDSIKPHETGWEVRTKASYFRYRYYGKTLPEALLKAI